MAKLLMLTDARGASVEVLPALGLLGHRVRVLPLTVQSLVDAPECDVLLLDARTDLAAARNLAQLLHATGSDVPALGVFTEGGLAALTADWRLDGFLLADAGPAEVEARVRLAGSAGAQEAPSAQISSGGLVMDEEAYTARIHDRVLDLTYKEFELLKYLAQHPGRVFTRAQLLQDVWGYDYFGGTRTVDVHVRRLRAKLGTDNEALIGTVRNVGYRFAGGREHEDRPRAATLR